MNVLDGCAFCCWFRRYGNTGLIIAWVDQSAAAADELSVLFAKRRLMMKEFHGYLFF